MRTLSYDHDRVSTVGRLARRGVWSSGSEGRRGLRTLRRELVGLVRELVKEAEDDDLALSLTSGTRSLPSAPGESRDRSRLMGEREEEEEGGDMRDSARRLRVSENWA